MLFENNSFMNDEFMKYSGINYNSSKDRLTSSKEGLKNGNMFTNLYDGYKGYVPKYPTSLNNREQLLLSIQECDFAINDLNLYLDLHPDDNEYYGKLKEYTVRCDKLKDEYNRLYGPLMLCDLMDEYEWEAGTWPWEGGNI